MLPASGETHPPPLIVIFEGIDATGKTTQVELLSAALEKLGIKVFSTGVFVSSYGRLVKRLFLNPDLVHELSYTTQLFLLGSAMNHVADEIQRRTEQVCLIDRFIYTTYAYHGAGLQIGDAAVERVYAPIAERIKPDLLLVFDMPVSIIASRKQANDRIETKGNAFYERVREYYRSITINTPQASMIDAGRSKESVHASVLGIVSDLVFSRNR